MKISQFLQVGRIIAGIGRILARIGRILAKIGRIIFKNRRILAGLEAKGRFFAFGKCIS
ncbi:MAG: hypothetical protein ACE3JP_13690 [Ectobacillus sp.]